MHNATKDAKSFSAVRVGDQPLVPPEIQKRGTALEVALAAIDRLRDLKRPRARLVYHRAPGTSPRKGRLP